MNEPPARIAKDPRRRSIRSSVIAALALAACMPCTAAQRSLAWEPSASAGVTGYYVYYGTSPGRYDTRLDAQAQTTYAVGNLSDGTTYYFAVAAYDATGAVSGYSNEVSATIDSTAAAPTASLSATPTSGTAPLGVTFTSLSSGTITSYLWEFGDGSTSAEPNAVHTYSGVGTFAFKLTVTGPEGSSSATGTVITTQSTSAGCVRRGKKKCF